MKKVIGTMAKIFFAIFGIAILGLLMSLTFGALGKIFTDSFTNQLWGLILFDIACIVWALVFVFSCYSTAQYAVAAIGFLAAFVGTLGMVAVETLLSGQTYVQVEPWVGQWLVYGFVLMTAIHSALLYAHHASAPDLSEKINVGIARGEIVTEAIKQATQSLEVQKAELARSITAQIVDQVKRDLGIASTQILDLPALPIIEEPKKAQIKQKPGFSLSQFFPALWTWKPNQANRQFETVVPEMKIQPSQSPEPQQPEGSEEASRAESPEPFRGDQA